MPGQIALRSLPVTGISFSTVATVSITVVPLPTPPTATPQTVTTPHGTPIAITLSGSDPNFLPLSYIIAQNPTAGTLDLSKFSNTSPVVTYTPNSPAYSGLDSFTFAVKDKYFTSAPATVTIHVLPPALTSISLSSTPASPLAVKSQVMLQATPHGTGQAVYQFSMRYTSPSGQTATQIIRAYSASPLCTWIPQLWAITCSRLPLSRWAIPPAIR